MPRNCQTADWPPEVLRSSSEPKIYFHKKLANFFFSTRCKLRDDWVTGKAEFVGAAVENSCRSDTRFSGTSHALIHQRFCLLPGRRRRPGRTSSAWWWSEPRRSGASSRWTGPWRSGWAGSSTARAGCELGTAARPAAPGRCKSPTIPCSWAWRRPWWSAIAAGPCCPRRGCPEQRRKQNEPPRFPCKTERERKRDHRKCYLDWFFSTRRGKKHPCSIFKGLWKVTLITQWVLFYLYGHFSNWILYNTGYRFRDMTKSSSKVAGGKKNQKKINSLCLCVSAWVSVPMCVSNSFHPFRLSVPTLQGSGITHIYSEILHIHLAGFQTK